MSFSTRTEVLQRGLPTADTDANTDPGVAVAPQKAGPIALDAIDHLVEQIGMRETAGVIRIYLETIDRYRGAIARAVTQGDLRGVGASLHALKSSSKTIGGNILAELAAEGEQLSRNDDNRVLELVPSIMAELDAFCRALSAHPLLDSAPAQPGAPDHSTSKPR